MTIILLPLNMLDSMFMPNQGVRDPCNTLLPGNAAPGAALCRGCSAAMVEGHDKEASRRLPLEHRCDMQLTGTRSRQLTDYPAPAASSRRFCACMWWQ